MPPEGGGTVQRSAGSLQLTIDDDDPGMAWADESIRNILGRSPSIHHGDLGWPKSGLRAARAIGLDITIHWLHSASRNAAARLTQRLLSSPYRLSGCGRGIAMARGSGSPASVQCEINDDPGRRQQGCHEAPGARPD